MSLHTVEGFAASLDNCQFDDAANYLAEDCKYEYTEGEYQGNNNIIAIYKNNDRMTRMYYDELVYSSRVEHLKGNMFRINYTDSLRKGEMWHKHHFYEIVKVENDKIVDIQHYTLPEEVQSMMDFYRKATAGII